MTLKLLKIRLANYYKRIMSSYLSRNINLMTNSDAIISFTFDDFPRSSFLCGGMVLEKYGFKATYFVSFGLLGKNLPVGKAFVEEDIINLIKDGHELGCHTYGHCDSWKTSPGAFRKSIIRNQEYFKKLLPEHYFTTFSYPKTNPHPYIKKLVSQYYKGCRGGDQEFNYKTVDLNLIKSFFIDKKNRNRWNEIKNIIDLTFDEKGWLILSTHDVCDNPSDFGCTEELFTEICDYVSRKGMRVETIRDVVKNYCKKV